MSLSRSALAFGPFRLEAETMRLWRGDVPVALQPRPLALLCYLVERPGVVIGSTELLARVWSGTFVTRAVLKVAVRALRAALGDDATAPRYVETVGREGYRFIGAQELLAQPGAGAVQPAAPPALVGRRIELARLRMLLRQAAAGRRGALLVSGEAGIGKTALIEQGLAEAALDPAVCVARGYCATPPEAGMPAQPILDAVARLARADRTFATIVRRLAPGWAPGASPARRGAEIAAALETFSARRTLVLVIEDLQWSDAATRAVLAGLARSRHPARLLVLASARPPGDGPRAASASALACALGEEMPLRPLSADDVAAYVALRFAGVPAPVRHRLAAQLHRTSEGNALFMVMMATDLAARGAGAWSELVADADELPCGDGVRALVARRIAALATAERRLLETASVVGDEFDAETLAAVQGEAVEAVEARCDRLASRAVLIAECASPPPHGAASGLATAKTSRFSGPLFAVRNAASAVNWIAAEVISAPAGMVT